MRWKRAIPAVVVAAASLLGFGGLQPLVAASAAATTHDVAISNFAFVPGSVTVAAGDSVRWTNQDTAQHTVTADNGSFDSGPLSKGQTFTRPFSTSGTFAYHCNFHPDMRGTVVVGGGGGGTSTLAVKDARVTEGAAGTTKSMVFTVTRSGSTAGTSTVKYATANGTATAGSDYTAVSNKTLTFAAGVTTMKAKVKLIGDNVREPDETFSLNLSAPVGATISDGMAVGTIVNDD
jgi:plastocyanin